MLLTARLRMEAFRVLVRNGNSQLLDQLLDRRKHGRCVRELREHDETNRQERCAARNAASTIASMRSVFPRICDRSRGFGKSV